MTKTIFGFTYKNNNVSKSAHISNVFKKSLDMLKSERIPNVLKSQHIYAVTGLDLESIPTKNKPLLRGRGNHHTYMPGMVTVKSDVNLSHRLMGQAQPSMMVVRPQAEDIKIQLPPMEGVKQIQLAHSEKVKHLQTFTQIEEAEKINHLAPYPLMDRASPQSEEKGYPPMVEKSFTPLGKTSVHKTIAKNRLNNYPGRALSKILKLVLADYVLNGVYSPLRAFFMRNISMRSHVMAKLERDTSECAGNHLDLSANPFQLCHPHLAMNGKAPKLNGVHSHA